MAKNSLWSRWRKKKGGLFVQLVHSTILRVKKFYSESSLLYIKVRTFPKLFMRRWYCSILFGSLIQCGLYTGLAPRAINLFLKILKNVFNITRITIILWRTQAARKIYKNRTMHAIAPHIITDRDEEKVHDMYL